ncbi:MAG: hypothetical protein ACR2QA_09180 [Solirubrobacteraceae bacterium]
MSTAAHHVPPEVTIVPPPTAAMLALEHARQAAIAARQATDRLLAIAELEQTPPELRTVVINPGNNGQYVVTDASRFQAKSIGVYNPGSAPVFLGIGGVSATPSSRAPSCPGQAAIVLPVAVEDLELGCDPAVLLAASAVVYVFRYLTVQALMIGDTT